ncbi:MAG TPA: cytochrome P450 [Nannocystaceae bacterium]|nr:cytochrome P450 [Nannocystaceae bacterium]
MILPRRAPGPKGLPVVGNALAFRNDPRGSLIAWARDYGPTVRFRLGPLVAHMVAHPEGVKHVLQTRSDDYGKAPRMGFLVDFLGLSLLTLERELWRKRRRLAQPAFHRERVGALAHSFITASERMVERWEAHRDTGKSFDVASEMMRVTLALAGETLLGVDISATAPAVARSLPVVLNHTLARMNSPAPLPLWMPTAANRRYHEAKRALDVIVMGLVRDWRSGRTQPTGLVAMLMNARDEETGECLSDRDLRDEVMTLMFAGHETTASALTWTWWLLAKHPDAARRVRAEVTTVLQGRRATPEDLVRLQYTQCVIQEAMRLMPPSWAIGRMPYVDDEIDGYRIPAGSLVILPQCVTHRDPAFWDRPDEFDPERFLPERSADRHRMAYYPFSAGPRVCIGPHFAMLEATAIVAAVAQRFALALDPTHEVRVDSSLTLRPLDGLWMRLQ